MAATSVASEQGVTSAGMLITKYGTCLIHSTIKAMVCLKSWNRQKNIITMDDESESKEE